MTVTFEAECSSDEEVDGLSGDDGVKVDWVFKDVVSIGIGGMDVGGVTLPILKVGRLFAVKIEFRTISKVPGYSQFLTVEISMLITAFETLLFSKVGIDWIIIVMLSGPPLVLTEVIDEERPTLLLCASTCEYKWAGCDWEWLAMVAAAIMMAICTLYYFLTFFLWFFFPERAAHSKSARIVVVFAVKRTSVKNVRENLFLYIKKNCSVLTLNFDKDW